MNVLILLFILSHFAYSDTDLIDSNKKFSQLFVKKETFNLKLPGTQHFTPNIVRMINDSTILFVDKEEGQIFKLSINNVKKPMVIFDLKGKIKNVDDVTFDSLGVLYVLDGYKNILKKFLIHGKEEKTFQIKKGEKLCLAVGGDLLIYNLFHPTSTNKEPVIHRYSSNGSYYNSFGKPPRKPTIDQLPISTGSIVFNNSRIIVCHGSDYIVDVYDIHGVLKKSYNKKPKFYSPLVSFKELKPKEIDNWNKTTQLLWTNSINEDIIISYYERVDGTFKFLFVQDFKRHMDLSLPQNLLPIGIINNNIYFFDQQEYEKNGKSLVIYKYEFQKNLFE